jgi:fucose permease
MAIVFMLTTDRWSDGAHKTETNPEPGVPVRQVLRMPLVWVQIALFHVMCGIEASAGLWTATMMIGRFDASGREAGLWAGLFWGSMAVGRLVLAPLSGDLNPARLIQLGSFGVLAGAVLMISDHKTVFEAGLLLLGLAMAPLFPTLMSLTPVRLGSRVALHAIGFQVSAVTLGIVAIPTVAGLVAERTTLTVIPLMMAIGAAIVIALETVLRARTAHGSTTSPSSV